MGWCYNHGPHIGDFCPKCANDFSMYNGHCGIHGYFFGFQCPSCQLNFTLDWKPPMQQRRYLPTLSELIDRLTIVQQKELKIPEKREEYTKEIEDLLHDIEMCLADEGFNSYNTTPKGIAQMIRDIIVLTLMNCEIWHNESNFRKGIKEGNNLELTHGLNGIRNTAKNKIQEKFGGRKDYKVDNVEAFKEWTPSGYGPDEK